MSRQEAIETAVGLLQGRDCVHLDSVKAQDGVATVVLAGALNGRLCTRGSEGWLSYHLEFRSVLALQVVELELWKRPNEISSAFFEVVGSEWLAGLGGNVKNTHRHIVFQTYDFVFEVACESFSMNVKQSLARETQSGRRTTGSSRRTAGRER